MDAEDELGKLLHSPRKFIRAKIRSEVDNCLWLSSLQSAFKILQEKLAHIENSDLSHERCPVCTLQFGTCQHTENWMDKQYSFKTSDEVDEEINDVMGVVGGGAVVKTHASVEDIDINQFRWTNMEVRLSDRIGSTTMAISQPSERGWHSLTQMGGKNIVAFGGLKYRRNKVPQPFETPSREDDVEYLGDTFTLNIDHLSWHKSKSNKMLHPSGRYGHVACALDSDRVLIFGGRGTHGRFLSDTWIFSLSEDAWTEVAPNHIFPCPPPRMFSACAPSGGDVYLFGGTNGTDNYCDLWVFRSNSSQFRWERIIAVGHAPSPRYGHAMIEVGPGRLAVLGGCAVTPQSEVERGTISAADAKSLVDLGKNLESNYLTEERLAHISGLKLQSDVELASNEPGTVKSLLKEASTVAGRIQFAEHVTRENEIDLMRAWQFAQAQSVIQMQKARHPIPVLDVTFLDVGDLMWKPPVNPSVSGAPPCCRMHFGAFALANFIFIVGGAIPTSLRHSPVDLNALTVHALDLTHHRWCTIQPMETSDSMNAPLRVADADIIRAVQRCKAEQARAKALGEISPLKDGARDGSTVELVQAEAVLEVCHWRKQVLQKQADEFRPPPKPRWGMGVQLVGQRAYFVSGWEPKTAVPVGEYVVLDMEMESERLRRLEDEFCARLERDRLEEDHKRRIEEMQSTFELRELVRLETICAENERRKMVIEEMLSSVPPLSKPPPVRFVKSNEHTIWVEWDRFTFAVVNTVLTISP